MPEGCNMIYHWIFTYVIQPLIMIENQCSRKDHHVSECYSRSVSNIKICRNLVVFAPTELIEEEKFIHATRPLRLAIRYHTQCKHDKIIILCLESWTHWWEPSAINLQYLYIHVKNFTIEALSIYYYIVVLMLIYYNL